MTATTKSARNLKSKFRIGQKVRHYTNGLTGEVISDRYAHGSYRIRLPDGTNRLWPEEDFGHPSAALRVLRSKADKEAEAAERSIDQINITKVRQIVRRVREFGTEISNTKLLLDIETVLEWAEEVRGGSN